MHNLTIILGSSSEYRKTLLQRLHIPFITYAPDIDETPQEGESALQLVERLSREKALAVAEHHPNSLIIASDQVAVLQGQDKILGKPGNAENAIQQLIECSGQTIHFLTGLAVYNSNTKRFQYSTEHYTVTFRDLTHKEIVRYVGKDQPYYCAGSFKAEGLGITLFEKMEGSDPNTLIGLPLIRLNQFLINEDLNPLLAD